MRLRPNRSRLEATVLALSRCRDGVGADLELKVHRCAPLPPDEDFIGALPGESLTAFVPVPEAVSVGQCYHFDASLLGGPQGERVVLSKPVAMPPAGGSPKQKN